jgi:hypothetical protein
MKTCVCRKGNVRESCNVSRIGGIVSAVCIGSHSALKHLFSLPVCTVQLLCNVTTCPTAASGIAQKSYSIIEI